MRASRSFSVALAVLVGGFVVTAGQANATTGYVEFCGVLGTPALCAGGAFNLPAGVAVDNSNGGPSAGDVYVADIENHRVVKFDGEGAKLAELTSADIEPGNAPFVSPAYVAVDDSSEPSAGDVYVSDYESHAVDVFTASGGFVRQIAEASFTGSKAAEESHHAGFWPFGVGVDPTNGDVLIADRTNLVIDEFSPSGAYVKQFSTGEGFSAFDALAVDGAGNVYVANVEPPSITEFNAAGEPVVRGGTNIVDGASPQVVAVDPSNNHIFVGENGFSPNFEIVEYASPGTAPLRTIGAEAFPAGGGAYGLAVNETTHDVYASDINGGIGHIFKLATLPDATTGASSQVTRTGATLEGSVNPEETTTSYYFEYGETTAYGEHTAEVSAGIGNAFKSVSVSVSSLSPDRTYYYRLVAKNALGIPVRGEAETVTTLPPEPSVLSESASQINPRYAQVGAEEAVSATVNPEVVNPQNGDATYHVLYGLTTGYGSSAPATDLVLGSGSEPLQAVLTISGLQPGTTYHYAVVAHNRGGNTTGPDETFTTATAPPPIVTTGTASEISQNSANISGSVDPQGFPTSYEFDLGTDTAYGSRFFGEAGAGAEAKTLSIDLQGLAPGTIYHYRLVATSLYGTVIGADQTFTTPAFPAALISAPGGAPLVPEPVFSPPTTGGAPTYAAHTNGKAKKKKKKTKPRGRKKAPHRDGQRRSR
jgi:NHL repeat